MTVTIYEWDQQKVESGAVHVETAASWEARMDVATLPQYARRTEEQMKLLKCVETVCGSPAVFSGTRALVVNVDDVTGILNGVRRDGMGRMAHVCPKCVELLS